MVSIASIGYHADAGNLTTPVFLAQPDDHFWKDIPVAKVQIFKSFQLSQQVQLLTST